MEYIKKQDVNLWNYFFKGTTLSDNALVFGDPTSRFIDTPPTQPLSNFKFWALWGLVVLGFLFRLPGLLFIGMHDVTQMLMEWGAAVHSHGVGGGYQGIYGVFSYVLFGFFYQLAELMPRFWSAPYKLFEIFFEFLVLVVLLRILPSRHWVKILLMFWVNPWFALHGAWQGFWEGPHTLMGLLAVYVLIKRPPGGGAWFLVGVALTVSGFFKPQGIVFFLVPTVIYLIFQYVLFSRKSILAMTLGCLSVVLAAIILVVLTGGEILAIPRSYALLGFVMPNLSNNSINIWRVITVVIQMVTDQSGPSHSLVLSSFFYSLLHLLAAAVTMLAVSLVCLRVSLPVAEPPEWDGLRKRVTFVFLIMSGIALTASALGFLYISLAEYRYSQIVTSILIKLFLLGVSGVLISELFGKFFMWFLRRVFFYWHRMKGKFDPSAFTSAHSLLLVLAICSILMPQFNTRMHINHAYSGLVFLIPFACVNRRVFFYWLMMITINFYVHLITYRFGRQSILPQLLGNYPDAQELIARLKVIEDGAAGSWLIQIQSWMNNYSYQILTLNGKLANDLTISILSMIQFAIVLLTMNHYLRRNADALGR